MSFDTPAGLFLLTSLVVLMLLHLLLRKIHRREVASLLLWEQLLRKRRKGVRTPRILNSLLVLLQVLALILLGTAAGLPRIPLRLPGLKAGTVVAIDTSASMAAPSGKTSRLEDAVALAADQLTRSRPPYTLVALADSPRVLIDSTERRSELVAALKGLTPSAGGGDTAGLAAKLMRSLGEGGRREVRIYTDRNLPEQLQGAENLLWYRLGTPGRNRGILSFSASHWGQDLKVRALLAAYSDRPESLQLEFSYQETIRVVNLELKSGELRELRFDISEFSRLNPLPEVLKLEIIGSDDLSADDTAVLKLTKRALSVRRFGRGNPFLDAALDSLVGPGLIETGKEAFFPEEIEDIRIVSGLLPPEAENPAIPSIRFVDLPAGAGYRIGGEIRNLQAAAVNPSHPLLAGDLFNSFRVARAVSVELPLTATPLFSDGNRTLVSYYPGGGGHILFHFDLLDSDLPVREEFPLLLTRGILFLAGDYNVDPGHFTSSLPGRTESDINRDLSSSMSPAELSPLSAAGGERETIPLMKLLAAAALLVLTAEALLQTVRWKR